MAVFAAFFLGERLLPVLREAAAEGLEHFSRFRVQLRANDAAPARDAALEFRGDEDLVERGEQNLAREADAQHGSSIGADHMVEAVLRMWGGL